MFLFDRIIYIIENLLKTVKHRVSITIMSNVTCVFFNYSIFSIKLSWQDLNNFEKTPGKHSEGR